MEIEDAYRQWASDAEVLAQIGRALYAQPTRITVRLPKELADRALASWQRDDEVMSLPDQETADQQKTRRGASTLSLIGLSVDACGVAEGNEVAVELDAWFIGHALQTADDAGLLHGLPTPEQQRAAPSIKNRADESPE